MKPIYWILTLLILHCSHIICNAQEPVYKHLNTNNGFISNTIYEIIQAKNGVVWIGSENGLICHKGSSTQLYTSKNTSSLAVSNILESADGKIWCQSFAGEFYFTSGDSLVLEKKLPTSGIYKLAIMLHNNTLCFYNNNEIVLYNTASKSIKKLVLPSANFIPFINQKNNQYYLYNNFTHQIAMVDSTEKLQIKKMDFASNTASSFATYLNNEPIFFTKINPTAYTNDTAIAKQLFDVQFKNKILNNVYKINTQQLALLSNNGFGIMNKNGSLSQQYLSNSNTSCMLKDNNNNIWVGTLNDGIYIIPNLNLLQYYKSTSYDCITKFNNQIVAGNNQNEIQFLNPANLDITSTKKNPLIHSIKAINPSMNGKELWYSNFQLNLYKPNNNSHQNFTISVNHIHNIDSTHLLLSESNCLSIFPVRNNDVWKSWLADKDRILQNERLVLNNKNFSRCYNSIYVQDTIYASMATGLFQFYKSGSKSLMLNNKAVNALQLFEYNKTVYIGTKNDGVLQYKNGVVSKFLYANNNAKQTEIYSIKLIDAKIYVLLYSGLDVFDINGKMIKHYLASDGFVGIDVSDFVVQDSNIVLATTSGLVVLPLDNSIIKQNIPQLIVSKILVNQKEYPINTYLELSPKQKFIEIIIDNCDYLDIIQMQQFYNINDGEWLPFNGNKISFNELASGEYYIKFKAINERGIQAKNLPFVHFIIASPYYKTWWFALSTIAIISILLWLGFRYRIKKIQERNKLLTDKINLEKALHVSTLSGIKSQMNPHFLFNALNTIQSYIYFNDKKSAGDYLVKFSELTRLILDNSNQETIKLSEEIKTIQLYLELEKMRFEENFEYTIDANNVDIYNIQIPSMLIQPYIENSIKHGLMHISGMKMLKISFEKIKNNLQICIEDNGIGIEASKAINAERYKGHESFANKANQKRIELLNEINSKSIGIETISIYGNSQKVIGTKIILNIPVS